MNYKMIYKNRKFMKFIIQKCLIQTNVILFFSNFQIFISKVFFNIYYYNLISFFNL